MSLADTNIAIFSEEKNLPCFFAKRRKICFYFIKSWKVCDMMVTIMELSQSSLYDSRTHQLKNINFSKHMQTCSECIGGGPAAATFCKDKSTDSGFTCGTK